MATNPPFSLDDSPFKRCRKLSFVGRRPTADAEHVDSQRVVRHVDESAKMILQSRQGRRNAKRCNTIKTKKYNLVM